MASIRFFFTTSRSRVLHVDIPPVLATMHRTDSTKQTNLMVLNLSPNCLQEKREAHQESVIDAERLDQTDTAVLLLWR